VLKKVAVCLVNIMASLSYAEAQSDIKPMVHVVAFEGTLLSTEDTTTISLYGLQLPSRAMNPDFADKALQALGNYVLNKPLYLEKSYFMEAGVGTNRYGDSHGQLFDLSGTWIQMAMIEKGYAFWSGAAGFPVQLRHALVNAENKAQDSRAGIWQTYEILNANEIDVKPAYSEFVIAEGRIRNVYQSAKMIFLNFGENWKTDFTVAISVRNKRNFEKQDWKLDNLIHKLVRIRGPLRSYNGPFMELSFPEQIDVWEDTSE
jgi:endonuclease YncB( thermonuclease family)